ncbi:MAG: SDR family NAD(P)-dependent oxidoreductase, partial [Spirochaetales bacterium]
MNNLEHPGDSVTLKGKVIVVTGGSRGLGAEMCAAFSEAGAKVIVNYNTSNTAAEAIVSCLHEKGCEALAVQADVADEQQVIQLIKHAGDSFGRIDVLINNAGVNSDFRVEELAVEEWDRVMAVNLRGTFLCSKHVIPFMRKGGYGRIINMSSNGVRKGSINHAHYSAAKVGIIGFTRSLARELGGDG